MDLATTLILTTIFLVVLFAAAWFVQRRSGDAGVVDVTWSFAFAPCAVIYAFGLGRRDPESWLVVALVSAWSLRLASYLYFHRIRGKVHEDGRYATIRRQKGASAQKWFFWFFQAQALSVLLLSASLLGVLLDPPQFAERPAALLLGAACLVVSIVGETIADRDLASFRADPLQRGKVCDRGLWRYSRHPNYFFEWLHWLAYPLFALGSSHAWMTWFAPLVMLLLILKVTGIPPTEAQAIRSRGEAYRNYQRTTSAFVPWFKKKVTS